MTSQQITRRAQRKPKYRISDCLGYNQLVVKTSHHNQHQGKSSHRHSKPALSGALSPTYCNILHNYSMERIFKTERKTFLKNNKHVNDLLCSVTQLPSHSPGAAHPLRSCHPCPGHTDGKQLEWRKQVIRDAVISLYENRWMLMIPVGGSTLHSQSSLLVLLLSGSLTAAFLFFSLSSIGLKWAKVRMKPLKFTWSSLMTEEHHYNTIPPREW